MKLLVLKLSSKKSKNNCKRQLGYFLESFGPITDIIVLRKQGSCVAIVEFLSKDDAETVLAANITFQCKKLLIKRYVPGMQ